jgi:polyferredoxin
MSLPVEELLKNGEIGHSECTLCATCIDSYTKGVIKFAFRYSQKNRE